MPIEDANLSNKVLRSCERGDSGTSDRRLHEVEPTLGCRILSHDSAAPRCAANHRFRSASLHLTSRRLAALERRERGELVCGVTKRLPQKSPQRFTALSDCDL